MAKVHIMIACLYERSVLSNMHSSMENDGQLTASSIGLPFKFCTWYEDATLGHTLHHHHDYYISDRFWSHCRVTTPSNSTVGLVSIHLILDHWPMIPLNA